MSKEAKKRNNKIIRLKPMSGRTVSATYRASFISGGSEWPKLAHIGDILFMESEDDVSFRLKDLTISLSENGKVVVTFVEWGHDGAEAFNEDPLRIVLHRPPSSEVRVPRIKWTTSCMERQRFKRYEFQLGIGASQATYATVMGMTATAQAC